MQGLRTILREDQKSAIVILSNVRVQASRMEEFLKPLEDILFFDPSYPCGSAMAYLPSCTSRESLRGRMKSCYGTDCRDMLMLASNDASDYCKFIRIVNERTRSVAIRAQLSEFRSILVVIDADKDSGLLLASLMEWRSEVNRRVVILSLGYSEEIGGMIDQMDGVEEPIVAAANGGSGGGGLTPPSSPRLFVFKKDLDDDFYIGSVTSAGDNDIEFVSRWTVSDEMESDADVIKRFAHGVA